MLTTFEPNLYYHIVVTMNKETVKMTLIIIRDVDYSNLTGVVAQLAHSSKDWFKKIGLPIPLQAVTEYYIKYNAAVIQFQILLYRSELFLSLNPRRAFLGAEVPIIQSVEVFATVKNWASERNEQISFLGYSVP